MWVSWSTPGAARWARSPSPVSVTGYTSWPAARSPSAVARHAQPPSHAPATSTYVAIGSSSSSACDHDTIGCGQIRPAFRCPLGETFREVRVSRPTTRVLALLELLQARPGLRGGELAERLGVDPRTVRRDAARLAELGIPVEAERG